MTDTHTYDLIVLGGGMSGLPVALKSAHHGLETALIERDLLGDTCLNRGCIPTKTMIRSAEVAHLARRADEFGVEINGETGKLLGAHIVGEQGADIVHELVLAIELGATADDVANTIHIHPTLPEVINSAAGGVHEPS